MEAPADERLLEYLSWRDRELWGEAMEAEVGGIHKFGVLQEADLRTIAQKVIGTGWVFI